MPYIVGSLIVIILALVGWYLIWLLVKDPEAPFDFQGVAWSHEIDPEESLKKIEAFANNVEIVFVEDVMALIGVSNVEAEIFLDYLVEINKLERHGDGDTPIYILT